MEKRAVASLALSNGWEVVKRHIEQRKDMAARELLTRKFEDLSEIKALQAQVSAYDGILGFVNGLLREARREGN